MTVIAKCREYTRSFVAGKWFVPALVLVTAAAMCTGMDLLGGAVMAAAAIWLLFFTDDTLAALCPVMISVVGLTEYYRNYLALLDYAWVLVPAAAALVVHVFAYGIRFVRGRFFWSLAAVSLSLITGGIGVISSGEYFSGVTMYYIIGLGAGLLLVYVLLCDRLSRPREYDLVGRLAALLYGMALLAALIIILYYVEHWAELMPNFRTPFIGYRNFCTTVMLFGLPMCCHFVKRNHIHLLGMTFIYIAMLAGGSRSALLFGSLELALCLGYIYMRYPEKRKKYRRIALICALPVMAVCLWMIYTIFIGETGRMNEYFIRPTEARPSFYRQGIRDFLSRPVFGYGIGNMKNAHIYQGTPGSIIFYHNSTLQVMASLGLVGCAAFLWQLVERVRLLWEKRSKSAFLMLIPFIGILLISQTNPGSFCPLPTALLLVIMFAVVEYENCPDTVPAAEALAVGKTRAKDREKTAVPAGI